MSIDAAWVEKTTAGSDATNTAPKCVSMSQTDKKEFSDDEEDKQLEIL